MNHLDANGLRVVEARVTLPYSGAWVADVVLAGDEPLVSPVVLTLGNLVLVGTVVRDGAIAGDRTARLVAGAGGWRKPVVQRSYTSPVGVPAATVLNDLMIETGEVIAPEDLAAAQALILGTDFVREAAPASQILKQVVGAVWWIDPAGVTHTMPRLPVAAPIVAEYLVEEYQGGRGRVILSTEDLAAFQPGAVLSSPQLPGPLTLSSVSITANADGRVRVEALVAQPTDRLESVLDDLIRARLERLTFLGTWEYQVTSTTVDETGTARIDGLPVATAAAKLPGLVGAALRPPFPGATAAPAVGSLVLVRFVNGEPSRPYVESYDATATGAGPATLPAADIGGTEPLAIAAPILTWAAAVTTATGVPALDPSVAATKARGA